MHSNYMHKKISLQIVIMHCMGPKCITDINPLYYEMTDINNHQRLIRALSVIKESGKTFSSFRKNKSIVRNFEIQHSLDTK